MPDLPPLDAPRKRSVLIEGHATSVTLEDAFWRALGREAEALGLARAALIGAIDRQRPPGVGLATALRLFVLARTEARAHSAP
ncbi:ribbon-helix-helix domain-containing protein [Paracoccus bogoriensis]|nr:ribbon-helix-helix domain-containing protein [Paracoccus bogoriensis]MBW7056639.1 ribbon-helix-helix domain-containing protein [Paracoccus bogoriensis]